MANTFVLVHGGFGTPAELSSVIPHLEATGSRVINVDLPIERPEATLEDYAAAVVKAMEGCESPRILVAHSAGGVTIPLAAARSPVDHMVFVTAFVPEAGRSLADVAGPDILSTIESVTIDNGDGTRSFNLDLLATLAPPEEREAYLKFLQATQRKQGWLAITQPWPGAGMPDIRRSYVLCTEDTIIPPERQRAFAAALGVTPVEIAAPHAVFATKPRELADILISLVS